MTTSILESRRRGANQRAAVYGIATLLAIILFRACPDDGVPGQLGSFYEGQPVPAIVKTLSAAEPALIIFVDSNCPYSRAALPFHQQLISATKSSSFPRSVIVTSREPVATLNAYVAEAELESDRAISIGTQELGLRFTPSVLLISNGSVQKAWIGAISKDQQETAIHLLRQ